MVGTQTLGPIREPIVHCDFVALYSSVAKAMLIPYAQVCSYFLSQY